MSDLPKLTLKLMLEDPEWVAEFVEGEQWAVNRDSYQKEFTVEVEVVQLNLNTGGMRIRFPWPSKRVKKGYEIRSQDVDIKYFFNQYEINEKLTYEKVI